MCTEEKILSKIKNLLDLSNNNPNENEAIAAALKAQELMAKYDIKLEQLDNKAETREIVEEIYRQSGKHEMKKWKYGLARIISKNFRCKYYVLNKSDIVFYGFKEDAKIALEVFAYLYETGNKLAVRYYNQVKKSGAITKGVMNTYLTGFKDGIGSVLDKQCTALMIIVPKKVSDSFEEKSKNFSTFKSHISTLGYDNKAYSDGKIDGKNMVQAKALNG